MHSHLNQCSYCQDLFSPSYYLLRCPVTRSSVFREWLISSGASQSDIFSVLTLIPLALYGWKNTKAPTTGRMCSTGAWNYPQHQHNPMHWNFVAPWFLCTEILSPSDSYVLKFCTLSDSNALKFCPPPLTKKIKYAYNIVIKCIYEYKAYEN